MSETTVKYPASLVPVGQFAGKPAVPLTRSVIVVGSSKHSRILLKSDTVSSVHTLLIHSNGRWYFRDLVSRTHTILNGKSIRESGLKNGDTITIGAFVFHVVAPEVTDPIQPPAPAALDITDAEMPVPIDTKTVLIGKRPGCEIRLMEEGVSTAHAVIFEHDGRHFIRDLYSRGGTTLNGKKIHQEVLKFGDVVVVGETTIRYIPDQTANLDLLSEAHAPAISMHDEAMESRDVPLVAHDVSDENLVPEAPAQSLVRGGVPAVESPASEPPITIPPAVAPAASKPAEILANLPPGLSSLLKESPGAPGRGVAKPPAEFIQAPPEHPISLDPIEPSRQARAGFPDTVPPTPGPLSADDDLVVPLRRRSSLDATAPDELAAPAQVETPADIEPSAIAPEVDEVREAHDLEPVAEKDLVSQADVEALQPAVDLTPEAPAVANRAVDAEPDEAAPITISDEASIDVLGETPTDQDSADESVVTGEVAVTDELAVTDQLPVTDELAVRDEPVETDAVVAEGPTGELAGEPAPVESEVPPSVETIDLADEVQLVEAPAGGDVSEDLAEAELAEEVEVPAIEPEVAWDEPAEASEGAAAPVGEAAAVVEPDGVDVASVSDAAEQVTGAVDEVADTSDSIDPSASGTEPAAVVPLDVQAFAEQIRRDFAAQDAGEPLAVDAAETARDEAGTAPEEAGTVPATEDVAAVDEPRDEPAPPVEAIADTPELRQLADLQARIAAALRDPSTITPDPVLPPDAALVSDPASAMSAAARRARLIAEMLDTSEPIEEEAEREAKSIAFDESVDLPPLAPVSDVVDEIAPPVLVDESTAVDLEAPSELTSAPDLEAIDIADTLPADVARGDDVSAATLADVVRPDAVDAHPSAPPEADVELPASSLPSAVELSESPSIETVEPVESTLSRTSPASVEPVLPAAEALDAPLDFDEAEPTLPAAAQDESLPRQQDVFDAASIDLVPTETTQAIGASRDDQATGEPLPDEALGESLQEADFGEVEGLPAAGDDPLLEAGTVVGEPLGAAPLIDPDEPVSDSADDTLLAEHPLAGDASEAGAGEAPPLVADVVRPDAMVGITAEPETADETINPVDEVVNALDEVANPFDESSEPVAESALEIEPLETPDATEQVIASAEQEIASSEREIEIDDSIAPIEADQPHAGDAIALGTDLAPVEIAEIPEETAELEPAAAADLDEPGFSEAVEGVERAEETELAEPVAELLEPAAVVPEIAPEAEASDPIASHPLDRIFDEAEEPEPLEGRSRPLIAADEHLVEEELEELPSINAFQPATATDPVVEGPAEVGTTQPADVASEFLSTADLSRSASEPEVPAGSLPEGRSAVPVGQHAPTNVVNVKVPSLEDLQAEFDSAFEDALKMAEGQSFAGTKPRPAAESPREESEPDAKPEHRVEAPAEAVKPVATGKSVLDLKVPNLQKLEAEFNDAFAEAVKMAEGASFAQSQARKADDLPTGSAAPKPRRAMPEFKLDESLLDQAQDVSPLGGSAAATGPAAFMNLGGIGWIGDPALDDFEIADSKKKAKPRRSRPRRPVGDQRPPTLAGQSDQAPLAVAPGLQDTLEEEAKAPGTHAVPDDAPADLNAEGALNAAEQTTARAVPDEAQEAVEIEDATPGQDTSPVPPVQEPESDAGRTSVPTILPPRPTRRRKGEAVVDQALSVGGDSPFAAQELPLVDAFSQMPTPQLDEVLARLNTTGGAIKDHPPISQDRPVSEGKEIKVPASPFASQIPIAQPAGSVRRVRQRVSKLPLILGLMLVATAATFALTWLIPVPRVVRGEVTFHNLNNTAELIRTGRQREILAKLPELQRAARGQLEDMYGGGFLDRPEEYAEIVRNARFDPKHPELLVIEVPSNVNQAAADQTRLKALLNEFVKANKHLVDEQNRLKDEIREIDRARTAIETELATRNTRYEQLGAIYETGTAIESQLKKVTKELATLDESRKAATRDVDRLEAEIQRLEKQMLSSGIGGRGSYLRPLMGIALADASGALPATQAVDPQEELVLLKRQREDLKARLERLTAARSPETAAARENFDRALEAFSEQVEKTREALGDRPEVLNYVQSATRLQGQIREITDTLFRRQEQQITRLNELGMELKELTQANREERINGNPQLKEWMDRLAIQQRRLNVAKDSNASPEEIGDLEREVAFLNSSISAQQETMSDPKELTITANLEKMIETTKKDMATDRERNEAILQELQDVVQNSQPVVENLPAEQRQITQSLTERLAQISLARQRYMDSLAVAAGTDDTLIASAKAQLEQLDKSIADAEARAQDAALAQSQVMEQRTELARQVDEVRSKALAARANRDAIEKQYYDMLAKRDDLTAKLTNWRSAIVERDDLQKRIEASKAQRGELIARREKVETQLKFAVVPMPVADPVVLRTADSDPRLKYFGISVLAIVALGGTLIGMEFRNRIPVPPNPEGSADPGSLSHTPTVA